MSHRSVYRGESCMHCGQRIAVGRAFFGSTYYVDPKYPDWVRAYRVNKRDADRQVEIRIAYHRTCIERVLTNAPVDREQAIEQLETYRERLLEQYGAAPDNTRAGANDE